MLIASYKGKKHCTVLFLNNVNGMPWREGPLYLQCLILKWQLEWIPMAVGLLVPVYIFVRKSAISL